MVKASKEEDELAAIRARLQLERAQLTSEISSRLGLLSPSKPKPNGTTSNPFGMGSGSSSGSKIGTSSSSSFIQRPATLGLGAELSDMDKRQTMSGAENARLKGVLVGKRKREVEENGAAAALLHDGDEEEDSRARVVEKSKVHQNGNAVEKKSKAKIDPFTSKKEKAVKGKGKAIESMRPNPTSSPTEEELQSLSKKARKKLRKRLREEVQGDEVNSATSQPGDMKKESKVCDSQMKSNGHATNDEVSGMTTHQKSLMSQLSGARFRQINETLYTSSSSSALSYIQSEPTKLQEYHEGFREQVKGWPKVPVKQIAKMLSKAQEDAATSPTARKRGGRFALSPLVVDLGAGEAILAKLLQEETNSLIRVVSYDLLDSDDGWVRGMDVAKGLPFPGSYAATGSKSQVVDVAVFCLSLMGTNWVEMIMEATRILRQGGELIIAEVTSRFNTKDDFIKLIASLGFILKNEHTSNTHFVLFEFVKAHKHVEFLLDEAKRDELIESGTNVLKPCIYKRR